MGLTVITNEDTGRLHLGNLDRDDPGAAFDRPQRLSGCIAAAADLSDPLLAQLANFRPIRIGVSQRFATDPELQLVHPREYVEALRTAAAEAEAAGEDARVDFGTEAQVSGYTALAAINGVGACLDAVDVMLQSRGASAFAVVWPAGHHAEPDAAMGFCYLSNAAIAAKYARDHKIRARRGEPNRVVVIDLDHHRGNGTGAGTAGESDLLFVDVVYKSPYDEVRRCYTDGDSFDPVTGRYNNSGKEYPYTRNDDSIGARAHRVVTAPNILSLEMGQSTAEQIMERFITEALPRIRAFKPDIILWSLGLDSALGDPLGGLGNLPSSFYTFTRGMRLAFPKAKHCGVLEGGYQPENWGRCLKPALLGLHVPANEPPDRSKFFAKFKDRFMA